MYGIFTYIWVIFSANVGKYSIHGAYGILYICGGDLWGIFRPFRENYHMYNLHSVYLQACAWQRPGNVLTIADVLEEVKYIVNRPGFY